MFSSRLDSDWLVHSTWSILDWNVVFIEEQSKTHTNCPPECVSMCVYACVCVHLRSLSRPWNCLCLFQLCPSTSWQPRGRWCTWPVALSRVRGLRCAVGNTFIQIVLWLSQTKTTLNLIKQTGVHVILYLWLVPQWFVILLSYLQYWSSHCVWFSYLVIGDWQLCGCFLSNQRAWLTCRMRRALLLWCGLQLMGRSLWWSSCCRM